MGPNKEGDPSSSAEFWEKQLGDVNFQGIYGSHELLDHIYDDSEGTPEQIDVFQRVKGICLSRETFFHSLANALIDSENPPVGVKRKGGRCKFSIGDTENKVDVDIQFRKHKTDKEKWICETVKFKRGTEIDNVIRFDKEGKISFISCLVKHLPPMHRTKRKLGYEPADKALEELDKAIEESAKILHDFDVFAAVSTDKPSSMGLYQRKRFESMFYGSKVDKFGEISGTKVKIDQAVDFLLNLAIPRFPAEK